jgi:hypothetical protein
LHQDARWQYHDLDLLDFEDETEPRRKRNAATNRSKRCRELKFSR